MNEMKEYTVREWTLAEFKANRSIWTELLLSSNADPLFSSWEWQYSWWSECDISNKKLRIIAVYLFDQLVALAPLFTYKKRLKKIIPITRCQFIGCSYDLDDLCRSDNLDIIILKSIDIDAIYQQILSTINNLTWHEFIVDGARKSSHIWQLSKLNKANITLHIERKIYNHIIELNRNFQSYVTQLKRKVRQKTILHRRFIENKKMAIQAVVISSIHTSNKNYLNFFSELNRLKELRWSIPVYQGNRLEFQKKFILYCQDSEHLRATSTLLNIEGENQSAFHSIQASKQNYFIQFAFNPTFNRKISLGYLHLGYSIEQSYQDNLAQIQLLPGGGQSENYKHHFANKIQPQLTFSLIRSKRLTVFVWLNALSKLI